MTRRFPLLDGSELDLSETLDPHPDVDHSKAITLRQDYAEESLAWWESYATDSGPASPTINGLATVDGSTELKLDTGSGSSNDTTAVRGPTINWSNWTEIRVYLWGARGGGDGVYQALHLSDADFPGDVSEGIYVSVNDWSREGVGAIVKSGGTTQNSSPHRGYTVGDTIDFGMRIYENDTGTGFSVDFMVDGAYFEGWSEDRGWPNATDLTFRHSVTTEDGSQEVRYADGWLIELIP